MRGVVFSFDGEFPVAFLALGHFPHPAVADLFVSGMESLDVLLGQCWDWAAGDVESIEATDLNAVLALKEACFCAFHGELAFLAGPADALEWDSVYFDVLEASVCQTVCGEIFFFGVEVGSSDSCWIGGFVDAWFWHNYFYSAFLNTST